MALEAIGKNPPPPSHPQGHPTPPPASGILPVGKDTKTVLRPQGQVEPGLARGGVSHQTQGRGPLSSTQGLLGEGGLSTQVAGAHQGAGGWGAALEPTLLSPQVATDCPTPTGKRPSVSSPGARSVRGGPSPGLGEQLAGQGQGCSVGTGVSKGRSMKRGLGLALAPGPLASREACGASPPSPVSSSV